MPSGAPLTRIQIDCSGVDRGDRGDAPSSTLFGGLPIGGASVATLASANASASRPLFRKENATGAERQSLLARDDEAGASGYDSRDESCVACMRRIAPCLLYLSCALTLVVVIVFLVLFYLRVDAAVKSIDGAVSIKARAINAIKNVDTILNKSAEISALVNQLGGLSLNAAMFSQPYLTHVLNTTTNAIDDVHRLVERPTIQLNGRRRR